MLLLVLLLPLGVGVAGAGVGSVGGAADAGTVAWLLIFSVVDAIIVSKLTGSRGVAVAGLGSW